MSGIEGVAVAVGGRLLATLAAPAAQALSRKVLFRRKVARLVRRAIDISCPWRIYRSWLKMLTQEELGQPVEEVVASLAVRLDAALTEASAEWKSRPDHLSQAVRLVEATYPAIAAALGDVRARQLSEGWAQQRSSLVRERLEQLVGPGASLSAADLAAVLLRRSAARRAVRLQAFGLEEAALSAYFDLIVVPSVPVGQVCVLLGGFGAGKSEVAEAWHRCAIEALRSGVGALPFPVWLRARELASQTLEDVLDRQCGPIWRNGRGARIVVDGLDEIDVATAQGLLDGARVLSRSHENVDVLLTARPGVVSATEDEHLDATLLSEEDALALVELAGGKPRSTWRWTAEMRATVRRPFFALAAGAMLGREQAPRGEADLIRSLVEDVLSKGAERSTVASSETFLALKRLAVALTSSRQEGALSFSERQVARSSRLVTDNPPDTITFSLPIFQHWFAAQAILDGTVHILDVVADASSFNRWRWAAAVAALSAPGPAALDDLLSTWVAANPGAAAWIIKEAFSEHRTWRGADGQPLEPDSGARLLRALRTWADALGPLAPGVLPDAVGEGPIGLGVSASGRWISVGLAVARPEVDYVAKLPPQAYPLSSVPDTEWLPWFSGTAPEGDAWPWTLIRDRIAENTLKMLEKDPYLGAPSGVWRQERRFDIARRLAGRGSLFQSVLSADEVRSRASQELGWIGGDLDVIVQHGSYQVSGLELRELVDWIDSTGATDIAAPLPAPDMARPQSGWVWDRYSHERLMEFEVEVYGRACEAYDEALTHTYYRLGWSMPGTALRRFGVVLEMADRSDRLSYAPPGLTVVRVPMPLIAQLAPTGPGIVWSKTGRAVISLAPMEPSDWNRHLSTLRSVATWLAGRNQESFIDLGWSRTGTDDMAKARPSVSIAAQWIWDDLKSLGLARGTFPQLR